MPALTCAATTCIYNKDELCSKGDIKVGGEDARHSDDTFCASFVERGKGSVTNSAVDGCGCSTIDICCEACTCKYNRDEACTASQIGIEGSNACECTQTECGSFCCKN